MSSDRDRLAALLHEAAETHHTVYRITDGDDPDWASWYASWLLDLSELPDILRVRPVRSHLVHALVQLDRDYASAQPADRWENWYAERLRGLLGQSESLRRGDPLTARWRVVTNSLANVGPDGLYRLKTA